MITTSLLILGGFFVWPLWILAFIAVIWLVFEKREALCPRCDWQHVIKS